MKKLCAVFLLSLFLLGGCDAGEMSTLRDLSRPYTGEYSCRELTLGSEDMLGKFESVKLALDGDGNFELFYRAQSGEGSYRGKYRIEGNEALFFANRGGREMSYRFPYEEGEIRMDLLLGKKLLHAVFSAV